MPHHKKRKSTLFHAMEAQVFDALNDTIIDGKLSDLPGKETMYIALHKPFGYADMDPNFTVEEMNANIQRMEYVSQNSVSIYHSHIFKSVLNSLFSLYGLGPPHEKRWSGIEISKT
jgi:hypothetical protein